MFAWSGFLKIVVNKSAKDIPKNPIRKKNSAYCRSENPMLNPINFIIASMPIWLFWTGIVIAFFGVFFRLYSVWTLRKYFTLIVQVSSEQKLIRNGPYKYLRHPSYTGSILTLLGISLAFRSPLGVIMTLIITSIIYGYRIKIEEKALEKNFISQYKDYKSQTWRIVPYIW